MTHPHVIERLPSGARNLDALLHGGIPRSSAVVIAGPPGAGKTTLAQQICFESASPARRALYFNTLSEPTAKTLRNMSQFEFFDRSKLDAGMQFVDLGAILRAQGLEHASELVMDAVRETKPEIVVIDSFKVFEDLAHSREELRKFSYHLAVQLMAWQSTCLLLGEFSELDIATGALFSVVDGLIVLSQREESGEQQRFLQIVKMRGTDHSRDEHAFVLSSRGIDVFAPKVTIGRDDRKDPRPVPRLVTGISRLDDLLGDGIPRGSSLLVSGVAGTGKTVLLLELLYRGAQAGEKGIIFSFEETTDRLHAAARGLGLDLDRMIEQKLLEIVFIPQPSIQVEQHMLMIQDRVAELGAQRVCVDSVSVFLHKLHDERIAREKIFQLASIVQNAQAVGFFATDIPYGSDRISRFGVEETVVDGVILLSSAKEGLERRRYLEIYKLRNTAHLDGRHSMTIGSGGVRVFPRYNSESDIVGPPQPIDSVRRIASGIAGLDELIGGGLLQRSVSLVSGSAGIGKTSLAMQFVLEGCRNHEPGLYVALEEGPEQLIKSGQAIGQPLDAALREGVLEILYLPAEQFHSNQLLSMISQTIEKRGAQRVVIDSVTQLAAGSPAGARDGRLLLQALTKRLKRLGATSLFTLEAAEMYSSARITGGRLSPAADNLFALRYIPQGGLLEPCLMIIKCRGSRHQKEVRRLEHGPGGVRIGARVERTTGG